MTILSTDLTRKFLGVAAATLALALAGCASTSTSQSQKPAAAAKPATPAPAPAPAPTPPPAAAVPQPTGDMGTIVFFRESKFVGAAVSFKVREGDKELGKLSSGTYFIAQVPTGAHTYTVHSEAKDVLNLEVERGETYYVAGSVSMGLMVGRPNLAPSDAATFNTMKPKLKDSAAPKPAKKK